MNLRKAAEQALKQLQRDDVYLGHRSKTRADAITALRQALGLQTAIERGTRAWADVPNATEWLEELRGNDTPEVTPEVPCKTHPDAPHGFNRNASHSADRYVCECEGWEPVDNVYMSEKRVHKSDKFIHELDLEAPLTVNGVPLYPKREWVGLTDEERKQIVSYIDDPFEWSHAIEAKLKEKNT